MKGTTRKISQKGGLLNVFAPLTSMSLPLMKNVFTPLAKKVLVPLPLKFASATSAIDAAIQRKVFGSETTRLIISNEEMDTIIKIVKSLEESGFIDKKCQQKMENEAKKWWLSWSVMKYIRC